MRKEKWVNRMIRQMEMKDIAKETIEVLKCFDSKSVSKIPYNFLKTLVILAQESTLNVYIDRRLNLHGQDISEGCKDLLSLIYYNYMADDEDKRDILKAWQENGTVY